MRRPHRRRRPELLAPPVNTLRVSLHPDGLAAPHRQPRRVERPSPDAACTASRVASADPELGRLYERAARLPGRRRPDDAPSIDPAAMLFVPLVLRMPSGRDPLLLQHAGHVRHRGRHHGRRAGHRVVLPRRPGDRSGAPRMTLHCVLAQANAAAIAAPVAAELRYGSGACARWPLSMSTSSTRAPNLRRATPRRPCRRRARTLTQRSIEPGHWPWPSTGARVEVVEHHRRRQRRAERHERVHVHCGWFASAMYDSTVPERVRDEHARVVADERLDAAAHLGRAGRDRSP